MKWFRRFRLYLIGVGIGILMVMILFKDKAHLLTSWLPGNRVKQELADKSWEISNKASCQLRCLQTDTTQIKKALFMNTSVEFSASDTHSKPRRYLLIQEAQNSSLKITFLVSDSTAQIADVQGSKPCVCP